MSDELKSWYRTLYPMHSCSTCGLEHVRIPTIQMTAHVQGQPVESIFTPFELVGVVEGTARPGQQDPQLDTPAHVYGLFWGSPGAQQAAHNSTLFMN